MKWKHIAAARSRRPRSEHAALHADQSLDRRRHIVELRQLPRTVNYKHDRPPLPSRVLRPTRTPPLKQGNSCLCAPSTAPTTRRLQCQCWTIQLSVRKTPAADEMTRLYGRDFLPARLAHVDLPLMADAFLRRALIGTETRALAPLAARWGRLCRWMAHSLRSMRAPSFRARLRSLKR